MSLAGLNEIVRAKSSNGLSRKFIDNFSFENARFPIYYQSDSLLSLEFFQKIDD